MADGRWIACDTCAEVYFVPYGRLDRDFHGGFMGHGPRLASEGDLERAEDEADLLNGLETIASPGIFDVVEEEDLWLCV